MINIVVGIVLLILVTVDYKIAKPFGIDEGRKIRLLIIILAILNLILGIWF